MIKDQSNTPVSILIRMAMMEKGIMLKEFAAMLGKTSGSLSNQLNHGNMSAEEWRRMAGLLGYEVIMRSVDPSARSTIGVVPRTKRIIDGEQYDTAKAEAVCHRTDEIGLCMELYRKPDGQYFLVYAHEQMEVETSIVAVSAAFAEQFVASCLTREGVEVKHKDDYETD